jgi:hypothetical protein
VLTSTDCDSTVGGFTTTYATSVYHQWSCEFESRSWRDILDTTLWNKYVSDLRQVGGFFHQYNWPPRYKWDIADGVAKHHNPNPQLGSCFS